MSMTRDDFKNIYDAINDKDDIPFLVIQYPKYSYSTFISIYSQKRLKEYRQSCYRKIPNIKFHLQNYLKGKSILELSGDINISPTIVAKQILNHILDTDVKLLYNNNVQNQNSDLYKYLYEKRDRESILKKLLKSPELIENERLCINIQQSVYSDDNCSPLINYIRSSTGSEYEFLLQEKLFQLNIPYQTEDQLRKIGYPKTPDIKLEVPFAYKGFIVNWIESKASFCDDHNYKNTKDQIIGYKNRYGPGLAIFWFGYIDDLNNLQEDGVLISDQFPDFKHIELLKDFDQHLHKSNNINNNNNNVNNIEKIK